MKELILLDLKIILGADIAWQHSGKQPDAELATEARLEAGGPWWWWWQAWERIKQSRSSCFKRPCCCNIGSLDWQRHWLLPQWLRIHGSGSDELLVLDAKKLQEGSYLLGIAKAAQLNTALLCTVWPRRQSFQLKLFTKSGLEPSETVKIYLDLMDLLPERGLMDMWVSNFWNNCLWICILKLLFATERWGGKYLWDSE